MTRDRDDRGGGAPVINPEPVPHPLETVELARTLFEDCGDALFLFDAETERLIEANPAARRLCERGQPDLLAHPLAHWFRPEAGGGLQRLRQQFGEAGSFHAHESFLLRSDAGWIPVSLTVSRLQTEGRTLALVAARDLRERREADSRRLQAEAELRQVLTSVSDAFWSADLDAAGRFTYPHLSPVIETITGRSPDYYRGGLDCWAASLHPDDLPRMQAIARELLEGHRLHAESEYRVVRPDGTVRWVRDSVLATTDAHGRVCRLDGVLADITDRKQAEELLADQRSVLEQIAGGTPLDDVLTALVRIIEHRLPEALGSILLLDAGGRLRHGAGPSLAPVYRAAVNGLVIGPDVGSCGSAAYFNRPVEAEDVASDPRWTPFRALTAEHDLRACWSTPIRASDGSVLGTFAVYHRVPHRTTAAERQVVDALGHLAAIAIERRRAEETLLASEERFRNLFEQAPLGIYRTTPDGRILLANPALLRMLGHASTKELALRNLRDEGAHQLYPRHEFEAAIAQDSIVRGLDTVWLKADGTTLCVREHAHVHYNEDGSVAYYEGLVEDIDERTKGEAALRESEERYRFLFANNPNPMWVFDQQTLAFLAVNDSAIEYYGYTREEFLARTIADIRPPEDVPRLRQRLASPADGSYHGAGWRHKRKDGSVIVVDISSRSVTFEGRPGRLVVVHDVTQRVRAEDALRASEEKYRTLVENLEQCILLKDADLRIVAANRTFCAGLGRTEADVLGRTDFDLYPEHLAAKYRHDDQSVLAQGRRLEVEEQNLRSGELCTVRVVKTPVKDAQGRPTGVLTIFWDVTQQRDLEAQLRQAQKMEAIGLLAGGVAHDFNNLLTAILGNLSMLQADLPEPSGPRELAAAAEKAALRAATLTSQLLGFSRRSLLRPQPTDLNATLHEVVGLLTHAIDPRIRLDLRPASDLWTVLADGGQMNQVLMNLCLNARDAMPEGGSLVLETANVVMTTDYARLHLEARAGEFVRLTVRDTGHGVSPAIRSRIFEPFFTTKAPGKGTGLGLAMVFGIVKQHKGWVECHSEVGRGAAFVLYLPRHIAEPGPLAAPVSTAPPLHGRETILLADDEAMIRTLGRTILQRYGYQIILACDGQEAVEIYAREHRRIDLVLLDLTMPRLSGHDAFEQLLTINANVRVLFASGYSAEHLAAKQPERTLGFVAKPYRPEQLAASVRAALDRKWPAAP